MSGKTRLLCILFATVIFSPCVSADVAQSLLLLSEVHFPGARLEARTADASDLRILGFQVDGEAVDLVIRHDGSKRIVAWAIQTAIHVPDVEHPGLMIETTDHQLVDLRGSLSGRSSEILPGEIHRLPYTSSSDHLDAYDDGRRLEVTVPLIVYDDGSYAGKPRLADSLFRERAAEYRRLMTQVDSLAAWLDGPASDRSVRTARRLLADAGYSWLREDLEEDALSERVRDEWADGRRELALRRSHLPSVYLASEPLGEDAATAAAESEDGVKRQRVDEGSRVTSCAVRVSIARVYKGCGSSGQITVDEDYNYVCEPFTSIGGRASQIGTGTCFAGNECPPIFNDVGTRLVFDEMVWKRTVSNQANEFGFDWLDCVEASRGYAEVMCPCPTGSTTCPSYATSSGSYETVDACETGDGDECQLPEGCPTPIVVDVDHDGFSFSGTDAGVRFDIDADGDAELITWTSAGSDDALLALDRDGDGRITSGTELFGNVTPQPPAAKPNGFLALGIYDSAEEGGNEDGWITADDVIFSSLLFWRDANHDGVTQPGETQLLAHSRVTGISLRHQETRREDRHGNQLRWSALIEEGRTRRMGAIDVVFQVVE
jgi:hypothetical protein